MPSEAHAGFLISQGDGRPMYLQIVEQIKQRIAQIVRLRMPQ